MSKNSVGDWDTTANNNTDLGGISTQGTQTVNNVDNIVRELMAQHAANVASDTVKGRIEIAIQSEMEAASDTTLAVTPGRMHFHPGVAKTWAYITYSGGTPTLQASYNVTSITDAGTGDCTVTIATDFSSANWSPHVSGAVATSGDTINFSSVAAGSIHLVSTQPGIAVDPASFSFSGFGDQA